MFSAKESVSKKTSAASLAKEQSVQRIMGQIDNEIYKVTRDNVGQFFAFWRIPGVLGNDLERGKDILRMVANKLVSEEFEVKFLDEKQVETFGDKPAQWLQVIWSGKESKK